MQWPIPKNHSLTIKIKAFTPLLMAFQIFVYNLFPVVNNPNCPLKPATFKGLTETTCYDNEPLS